MSDLVIFATTRDRIAAFVGAFFTVYIILIFIRILMSWLPRIPYYRWLDLFLRWVTEVTDPWLNLFRRFIPLLRIGPGAIDLSPIVAIIVLSIVRTLIVNAIAG